MMDGVALSAPRRGTNPPDFLVKLLQMVEREDPQLICWSKGVVLSRKAIVQVWYSLPGKVLIKDPTALEKKMSSYFR